MSNELPGLALIHDTSGYEVNEYKIITRRNGRVLRVNAVFATKHTATKEFLRMTGNWKKSGGEMNK